MAEGPPVEARPADEEGGASAEMSAGDWSLDADVGVSLAARRADDAPGPPDAGSGTARHGRGADGEEEAEAETLRLSEFLRDSVVAVPLAAREQESAVRELVGLLVSAGELPGELAAAALESTREREAIRPTGWKYGLAFPNGRVKGLRRIVAAVGVSQTGIAFNCRDGLPAKIVVLFLFPEARYARFAPAIQDVAELFEDPVLRERVIAARTASEVVEAIEEAETHAVA